MIFKTELVLSPEQAGNSEVQKDTAADLLSVSKENISHIKILKRSIDGRSKQVKIRMAAEVFVNELPPPVEDFRQKFSYPDVSNKKKVIIVGAGPAGMFAALRLIELGLKPVIIERGKNIQQRRRDLVAINRYGIVNPDSNYCFGEGGAGTYSDGKLYTRSGKRGNVERILEIFVAHGADQNILIDAHPHIGTNKLPEIVNDMSQTILHAGGEIHFNKRVIDFLVRNNQCEGVIAENINEEKTTEEFISENVILATGHSSRDIFELLNRKNILIEAKPFALGLRIEHPQQVIDSIQYHCNNRSEYLPPASYSLTHQYEGRGVYSFCMCPGGIIAPAATAPSEIVVNGWSPSKRNNPFANSGMVVSVDEKDFAAYHKEGALAALRFQQAVEQVAFLKGEGKLKVPAQRMIDFVNKKTSGSLPPHSYLPGATSVSLDEVLPQFIGEALRHSLKFFEKKMKGYFTNEAILVAVESRTSSPVRIPRDTLTLEHPHLKGLYPCGEGAGFAGGIVSAAIDGDRCAEKCFEALSINK